LQNSRQDLLAEASATDLQFEALHSAGVYTLLLLFLILRSSQNKHSDIEQACQEAMYSICTIYYE